LARLAISFQSDKSVSRYRALADAVDPYPFETVSIYQDLLFQPPWPALLQFAERTTTPRLGPAVVNPYLTHPVLIAGHLATLDEASGGRAYLGVGKGAFFEAIGVAQPRPLKAIRECISMVQRLLKGDREPFDGEIFQATSQAYLRCPIPGRALPVLIGGWGPLTVGLAGEIADKVKIGGCANPDSAPEFRRRIENGAARVGRDPKDVALIYGAVTVVDRDPLRAEVIARKEVAMYVGVAGALDPAYTPSPDELAAVADALSRGDADAAGRALSSETLSRYCVFGTPRDIIRHLETIFDAGVDLFELGTPHGADELEAIRLLGEEVLPYFAS